MPHVRTGDIHIYYEVHGTGGQNLTMIRGLGGDLLSWFAQIPELSKHFRIIVFDNRGAGRTDKPDTAYSIQQMASDVNNLLDVLSVQRTALLGVSMGGMIAQEFALHYPEKLSCLVLGCTSFGGPEAVAPPQAALEAILSGPAADKEARQIQERAMYCDDTIMANRGVIAAHNEARSRFPIPAFALARQAAAMLSHDTASRLGQIRTPTLVITGKDDRLIPPENSRLIASRIPGAILKELPGGHLFASEHPDLFNGHVSEFVQLHP